MENITDFFLEPYRSASVLNIILEFSAASFGIASVWFAKKESILVYPIGIISTAIYVYLLSQWNLYGDLIINIYYTLMSLFGWYMWSKVVDDKKNHIPISRTNNLDKIKATGIFIFTSIFVILVYRHYNVIPNTLNFSESINYAYSNLTSGNLENFRIALPFIDTFTTGIFFAAMWLMALKKIENWTLWIIGNIASIPLYFVKGYGFTGIQYFVFLILAILAYKEWKKKLTQQPSNCIKVVLFGPESTGKTTLSKQLARHYNSVWVPEYAREYLQDKWNNERKTCEPKDLLPIAIGQMKLENELAQKTDSVLICDTDLLETKVYSEAYYSGTCDPILDTYALKNSYDIYFLTYIDTPWEADDLRDKPNERIRMFNAFEAALKTYNKPYVILKGSKEERLKIAIQHIDNLLDKKK